MIPQTRVVYATSIDRVIHAASLMQRDFGWEPVYWLASARAAPRISELFPDVLVHDYLQSVKGVWHASFASDAYTGVDMDFVREHSREISAASYMLERNNSIARDLTMRERMEFIYQLIAYWTGVLGTLTPNLVIFEEEPHQASDYLLYTVAKHQNINILMPIRTMPEWGFLLSHGYDEEPLIDIHGPMHEEPLSENPIPEYITRYRDMFRASWAEAQKAMFWDQLDRHASRPQLVRRLLRLLDSGRAMTRRWSLARQYVGNFRSFHSDQKEKGKSLQESQLSYFAYLSAKIKTSRAKKRNCAAYDRRALPPRLDKPFVYLALSYQPEKSTSPNGDEFVHQLLAVRMLSASLPVGWQLIVREHPSQFIPSYSRHYGEIFRDASYYESILGFENTVLASMNSDPYELMDKAEAVASVGGSSCFEALVRGRRALLFGHAWYIGCPGLSVIRTTADIQRALTTPCPVVPEHDRALDHYFGKLGRSVYRAPTAIGDAPMFAQSHAMDEYVRSYRDFHQNFLALHASASAGTVTGPSE